jgi:hypothetical protein
MKDSLIRQVWRKVAAKMQKPRPFASRGFSPSERDEAAP